MAFLSDPVIFIANWIENLLLGWGLAPLLVTIIMDLLGAGTISVAMLLLVVILIVLERKLIGRLQGRFGPNRVGPYGLLQTIPDMIKIFTKEYITPQGADIFIYNLAPIMATSAVLLLWAVIPYAPRVVGSDINVGVLYLVAVGALGTLAILLAGFSSNNKYALLGAFRTVAQMISYEVPMVLAFLVPVILARSMGVNEIVNAQYVWYVIFAPLATLILFITAMAEVGRAPFDLLEAESEIVAGFHIEYSGLKFGFFYVAEFLHAFTISGVIVAMFFGGWRGPGAETYPILGFIYFMIKTFLIYFGTIWVRGSLPRVRIDQLLGFGWKILVPVALTLVIFTAVAEKIMFLMAATVIVRILVHLVINLLLVLVLIVIFRAQEARHPLRKPVAEPRPVALGRRSVPPELPRA